MNIKFLDKETEVYEPDSVIFIQDSWNDYNYLDMFRVKYASKQNEVTYIGNCRIITSTFNDHNIYDCIKNNFNNQKLKNNFVSMGEDIEFYVNLISTLGIVKAKNILERINDVLVAKTEEIGFDNKSGIFNRNINNKFFCFKNVGQTIFRDRSKSVYDLNCLFQEEGESFIDFLNSKQHDDILDKFSKNDTLLRKLMRYFNDNNLLMEEFSEYLVKNIIPNNSKVNESKSSWVSFLELLKNDFSLRQIAINNLNKFNDAD